MKISIHKLFLISLIALFNFNNLQAQISIFEKSKRITTKSIKENNDLPAELLKDVAEYSEINYSPQFKKKSKDIEIGTILDLDFGNLDQYKATVIVMAEYIDGVKGIIAKLNDFNFAYVYLALSNEGGMRISCNIPEKNETFVSTEFQEKPYLLKYIGESHIQKSTHQCLAHNLDSDEINITPKGSQENNLKLQTIPAGTRPSYSFNNLDQEVTLRIMYVYTTGAIENLADDFIGHPEYDAKAKEIMHIHITMNMLQSQLTLDNSRAGIKLELGHIYITEHSSIRLENALNRVISPNDGIMDDVNIVRDKEKIDLTILAVNTYGDDAAGIAYKKTDYGRDRNKYGYVVLDYIYIPGGYVAIHELGHILGCDHHMAQTVNPATSAPSAWKGVINGNDHSTLMAYPDWWPDYGIYTRIPYFSSPDITLNGVTIGNDTIENNALVLKKNKHLAAIYGQGIRFYYRGLANKIYGRKDTEGEAIAEKNNFELREGDKIVFAREEGELVGKYPIYGWIEDSEGNDVTDHEYYKGNIYIMPGELTIGTRDFDAYYTKAYDKVYDGTTSARFDYSYYYDYTKTHSLVEGDGVTIDTTNITGHFTSHNVGTKIPVAVSGKMGLIGKNKYCYLLYPSVYDTKGNILPAPLMISAKPIEIVYGTNPSSVDLSSAYKIDGLVNNETESVLNGTLSITIDPSITATTPIGVYPNAITIQGYTADNYIITYQSADLIIKPSAVHPDTPINLEGEAISSTKIKLTWGVADKATGYNIKRSTAKNGSYTTITSSYNKTTYEDISLNPNTTYYYKISSLNAIGESFDSNPVAVSTPPELKAQTITFTPLADINLAKGTYQLQATASSGLPITYTSSNNSIASIDINGLATLKKAGKVTITANQAGNEEYMSATPISQDLTIVVSSENNLIGLTINKHIWDIANSHILPCGDNTSQFEIEITASEYASLWFNNVQIGSKKITVNNDKKAFTENVKFQIKAQDGTAREYTLVIKRYFEFAYLIKQESNTTLTINNDPALNGGYTFADFVWYKDGIQVGNQESYTEINKLVEDANYYVEVTTTDGQILRTCEGNIVLSEDPNSEGFMLYPNPVKSGELINLNLGKYGNVDNPISVRIYDLKGAFLQTLEIEDAKTGFYAPNTSGIYVVKIKAKNYSKELKIMVK